MSSARGTSKEGEKILDNARQSTNLSKIFDNTKSLGGVIKRKSVGLPNKKVWGLNLIMMKN